MEMETRGKLICKNDSGENRDDTEILFWLLLGGAALFAGGLVIRKGGRT